MEKMQDLNVLINKHMTRPFAKFCHCFTVQPQSAAYLYAFALDFYIFMCA